MKFPVVKSHNRLIIILMLLGLPILLAGIIAFCFPRLAAPVKPVPGLNIRENQLLNRNLITKTQAALVSMLQSGTGLGTIQLSEAEINFLLAWGLSRSLTGDVRFIACSSRLQGDRIYVATSLKWRGYLLGPELVLKPQITPEGNLSFILESARLGRLPLPKALLEYYLANNLPVGCRLTKDPLLLIFDPDSLISQVKLPIIKNPSLKIHHMDLASHKLRINLQLSFKLQF